MDLVSGESIGALYELYLTVAEMSATTRYCMVAGYMWVLYDWWITLDQEIEYVWRKPGGWKSKALYAFTRYYGLALLTYDLVVVLNVWSADFCHDYYYILGGAGLLLLFAVEGTLQLRVYVMYDCSMKLLIFNGVLFVIEMGLMISFYLLDTAKTTMIDTPPGLTGCWSSQLSSNTKYTKAMWWICLAFETWLSVLVLRVAWSNFKTRSYGLLRVLILDALLWFLVLTLCLGWNAIAWVRSSPGLILTGIPALHASATIGGSRLLLNLRAAYFSSLEAKSLAVLEDSGATVVDCTVADWWKHREDAGRAKCNGFGAPNRGTQPWVPEPNVQLEELAPTRRPSDIESMPYTSTPSRSATPSDSTHPPISHALPISSS